MNSTGWITYASLLKYIDFVYSCDEDFGNLHFYCWYLNICYIILFIPVTFYACYFIEKYGIRKSIMGAAILQFLGFSIRCLRKEWLFFDVIGQSLLAISQPFIINLPAKISQTWFLKRERLTVTMIATNIQIVGFIIGFYVVNSIVYTKELYANDPRTKYIVNNTW